MVSSSADPHGATVAALRAAGCVFAEDEADILLAQAADDDDLALMTARRVAGEPLEQVVGWAEFCGLRIGVAPGVFVPRTRTEALVDLAAGLLHDGHRPVVVDLCCGSGAIGVAIASRLGDVELHAADLDPAAVACARRNVTMGRVHEGDLFDALPGDLTGRVDVLAVNAPYVPTGEIRFMPLEARLHEHRVALDGGVDGLDLHRRVAHGAADWLVPGGSLLLETSPRQVADTAHFCTEAGLTVEIYGEDPVRVVRAISAGSGSSGTMTR